MKLNYCLECAAPLTKHDDTHYVCQNGHDYWNNPRATADVALVNSEGQILVSKRANEPDKGRYDLPGGFIEYGEDATDAAVREIKEETGMTIALDALELVFSCGGFYHENESLTTLVFLVREWEGDPVAADDSASLEWQSLDFLDSDACVPVYHGLRTVLESKL